MDPDDSVPRSDEGMLGSLSILSGPCFEDSPASESSVTMRMMDPPSSSPLSLEPLHQVDTLGYSHTSDGLPSKTLGSDVCTDISSNAQLAENHNISERSNFNPSSICATTDDFNAVIRQTTRQHMPNYSPSDHQLTDVEDSPIDNESAMPSASNVYSGLLADGDLAATTGSLDPKMVQSEVPDPQHDLALSSLPGPPSAHWQPILNHIVTDDRFHELSLLPPEILAPSKNASDDHLQLTVTPHLPERQAAPSLSLLFKSSHASYNTYNNNIAGSRSELAIDRTSPHAGHFACSYENTSINFSPNHSRISFFSQIGHTEEDSESHPSQARSPDLETQDMGIQEDLTPSPPLSPSMSSGYMSSSSPIPSSSPVGPSVPTPPTSPPSSPVKDTQLAIWRRNGELLIPGTRKLKDVHMDHMDMIPLSGIVDQHNQSMVSPEGSTLPLQHQAPILSPLDHYVELSGVAAIAAENSSNRSATILSDVIATNTEGEARLSNESDVEQKRPDSNVDAHRLKSMNAIPYPKRPTIAAHRLQQKKLAQPFRSPVLPQSLKVEPRPKALGTDLGKDAVGSRSPIPKEGESSKTNQEHVPPSSSPTLDSKIKIKYRTTRAATQFKSPLSAPNALDDRSLVRLTPTIQALERKLQILKRAVKVREDVQEEVLEGLVKKWSEAGREVAWEVWNLVKDNASSDNDKKRTFEGSWGWEGSGDAKRQRGEERERNWGWDVVPISGRAEEELDAPKHSLGTMLMQLGVASDTLGWNEEEETFIDKK